ncbi:HIG1 domain-containing protein [Aphelenchoides besseyi]|nr:HIG1 domain-containing protein [Aphelenchoides besseyi]KAI6200651.1 HIG1 domain-containing protein [Aphelenchoides besseyi]
MSANLPADFDSDEQLKRKLLWEKVNDPSFVESESRQKRQIYQSNSLNRSGVPMIPEDLIGGSTNRVTENKVFRNMSINPLVPFGMLATVGCLVGMCKASLNNNKMRTQYYMRGRIAAQFFTVCALVGGAMYLGLDPRGPTKPGDIPKEQDSFTRSILRNAN